MKVFMNLLAQMAGRPKRRSEERPLAAVSDDVYDIYRLLSSR